MLRRRLHAWAVGVALAFGLVPLTPALALTPADALAVVQGETDDRIDALNRLAAAGDQRAAALIRAMAAESVRVAGEQVLLIDGETATDAVSGQPVPLPDTAEDVMVNNRLRGALETALAGIELFGAPPERQREAARSLQRNAFDDPDLSRLPLIEKALAGNLDDDARQSLELAQAGIDPNDLRAQARRYGAPLAAAATAMFDHWLQDLPETPQ